MKLQTRVNSLKVLNVRAKWFFKFQYLPLTSLSVTAVFSPPKEEGCLVKSVLSEWVAVLTRTDDGFAASTSLF